LFHVDGCHDRCVAKSDLQSCWELAHNDLSDKQSIVIFDDTWLLALKGGFRDEINNGLSVGMSKFCPIKTDETFKERLRWIQKDSMVEAVILRGN